MRGMERLISGKVATEVPFIASWPNKNFQKSYIDECQLWLHFDPSICYGCGYFWKIWIEQMSGRPVIYFAWLLGKTPENYFKQKMALYHYHLKAIFAIRQGDWQADNKKDLEDFLILNFMFQLGREPKVIVQLRMIFGESINFIPFISRKNNRKLNAVA